METRAIAVVGCVAMNLTVITNRLPDVGESMVARNYIQSPGSKAVIAAMAAFRTSHSRVHNGGPDDEGPQYQSKSGDIDVQVRMLGAVGDDEYGKKMLEHLHSENIDVSGVETVPDTKTGIRFSIVMVPMGSVRHIIVPGATASVSRDRFTTADSLGAGPKPDLIIAHMDMQREIVEDILELAHRANIDVLLNASPAQNIQITRYRHIKHLLLQQAEAATLLGRMDNGEVDDDSFSEMANEFIESGVQNVIIGLPDGGIYYASNDDRGYISFPYEKRMDVTVRGGTCVGAYAAEYLRQKALGQWDIKACVIKAEMACAIAVQGTGGQGGVPWADDIENFQRLHEPQAEDVTVISSTTSN